MTLHRTPLARLSLLWSAAIVLLLIAPSILAARHALLIGIGEYRPSGLPDLPGAREDVRIMQQVLQVRFEIPAENIQVLLDGQATHRGIQQALVRLAERIVPGDFVYIHYSGHGSFQRDANDDEWRTGLDQTWVSHGARSSAGAADDLNRFDILDDELNQWLAPIAERAGELIYVADTCHSATNTRGEALVARAAPPADAQHHPLRETRFERHTFPNAVLVAAAQDDEQAVEGEDEQGRPHGLFTWHWARALQQAGPGDTWYQIFERAKLGVEHSHLHKQHPQLTGHQANRPLVGGKLKAVTGILVKDVDTDTGHVTLGAGRLSGVTQGSRYGNTDAERSVGVRIVHTDSAWSKAIIEKGTPSVGDFLVEMEHAYTTGPLRVYLLSPLSPADQPLMSSVRAFAEGLAPVFTITDRQRDADLVFTLLRPNRTGGEFLDPISPAARATFSEADPKAAPELWVLNPSEQLLHRYMTAPLSKPGLAALERNLRRYRRLREITRLAAESSTPKRMQLSLITYDACDTHQLDCIGIDERRYRRRPGTLGIGTLMKRKWQPGDLISFELRNPSFKKYVYLFNIDSQGGIRVIFPNDDGGPLDRALLERGERVDLDQGKTMLLLDHPGEESILLLVTRDPINPSLITQSSYELVQRGTTETGARPLNPLESLLSSAIHGTRGGAGVRSGSWGLEVFSFRVEGEAVLTDGM